MDIDKLKTQAEEDLQRGRPPGDFIEGTQWRVGLYQGYVLKTPRNLGTRLSAACAKPLMMLFTRIFRNRIWELIQN